MARHQFEIVSNKGETTWTLAHYVGEELVGSAILDTAEVVLRVLGAQQEVSDEDYDSYLQSMDDEDVEDVDFGPWTELGYTSDADALPNPPHSFPQTFIAGMSDDDLHG